MENKITLVMVGWGRLTGLNEVGLEVSDHSKSLVRNIKNSRLVLSTPTPIPPLFLGKLKGIGDSLGQRRHASGIFNLVLPYISQIHDLSRP